MQRILIFFVAIILLAACLYVTGCNKNASQGSSSTTTTYPGSDKTYLIAGTREFSHTIKVTSRSKDSTISLTINLNDTLLTFSCVNDATVAINGERFLYTATDAGYTINVYGNLGDPTTDQVVNFNYVTDNITFDKLEPGVNDTLSINESFTSL